jgi:hypothetical protein
MPEYKDFDILKMNTLAIVLTFVVILISLCSGIAGIVSIVVGYLCGDYAATRLAPKINGSQSWAFMIPFTFSLFGLLCYWIYYRYELDKMPPPPVAQEPVKKEPTDVDDLFDPVN